MKAGKREEVGSKAKTPRLEIFQGLGFVGFLPAGIRLMKLDLELPEPHFVQSCQMDATMLVGAEGM